MNQEVKTLWLEALRSGRYKQGAGQLYNPQDNTYCCLGVLCDISEQGSWYGNRFVNSLEAENRKREFLARKDKDPNDLESYIAIFGNRNFPSETVARWAGIEELMFDSDYNPLVDISPELAPEVAGTYTSEKDKMTVAELNDLGIPFTKIADLIENSL